MDRHASLSFMLLQGDVQPSIKLFRKPLGELTPEDVAPYGAFSDVPYLTPPYGDEKLWTLRNDFIYVSPDGTVVEQKEGDKSDLASTPNWVKALFGGPGKETIGSLIHDDGYKNPKKERLNIFKHKMWIPPKSWWDNTFSNVMMMCKTEQPKRSVFWWAVSWFGWPSWWGWVGKQKENKQ